MPKSCRRHGGAHSVTHDRIERTGMVARNKKSPFRDLATRNPATPPNSATTQRRHTDVRPNAHAPSNTLFRLATRPVRNFWAGNTLRHLRHRATQRRKTNGPILRHEVDQTELPAGCQFQCPPPHCQTLRHIGHITDCLTWSPTGMSPYSFWGPKRVSASWRSLGMGLSWKSGVRCQN